MKNLCLLLIIFLLSISTLAFGAEEVKGNETNAALQTAQEAPDAAAFKSADEAMSLMPIFEGVGIFSILTCFSILIFYWSLDRLKTRNSFLRTFLQQGLICIFFSVCLFEAVNYNVEMAVANHLDKGDSAFMLVALIPFLIAGTVIATIIESIFIYVFRKYLYSLSHVLIIALILCVVSFISFTLYVNYSKRVETAYVT